jgi:enoyl-CoA hydratase
MMSDPVIVSAPRDGVLLIRINRPERRNALNIETICRLGEAFAQAETDDRVRCAVLTGDQKAFSAGADISEMSKHGFAALERPERRAAWTTIERFCKPLVAAAEGLAFGGGLELLMLADIAIAGRTARFGLPEVRIGLIPGDGGTQRLPRLIGRARATRMILSGEPIGAEEACRVGLVADVVDEGAALEHAMALARTIAGGALSALRMAKASILASAEMTLTAGLVVERHAAARAFDSPEGIEGMLAFLEKRPPRFAEAHSERTGKTSERG